MNQEKILQKLPILLIFLFSVSFILADNYNPRVGLKYNIDNMELFLLKGDKAEINYKKDRSLGDILRYEQYPNAVKIPFSYIAIFSTLLIFLGIFLLIFKVDKKSDSIISSRK